MTRGQRQTAYQVLVSSSRDKLDKQIADLWDTGKVQSDQSIQLAYKGKRLESGMRCFWKVRVWDKDSEPSQWSRPAMWSMGLLRLEDWNAKWVTAPVDLTSIIDKGEVAPEDIRKATYQTLDGNVSVDVTAIVRKEIARKKPFVVHYKTLGGDPAPGVVKELVVQYVRNGKSATVRANDFQPLFSLPGQPCPWLRKIIDLNGRPEDALVQVESRGYHELWVNGRKVNDYVLTPAVSVYKKRTLYVTYDVKSLLREGSNVIGLWLGRGWNAHGIPGISDERPAVRLQGDLVVGGKTIQIITNKTWTCAPSPYRTLGQWTWDNYGGELYLARLKRPNWCTNDDSSLWIPVEEVTLATTKTSSQLAPLNRIGELIQAISCKDNGKDGYELDFGTDLTGWLQLKLPAMDAGKRVSLEYFDSGGRSYNQCDEFISAGRANEEFVSKFNYRGFRKVIVKGLPSKPVLTDAVALLIESDLEQTGSFECSNDLFNRIYRLNMWTIRCLNLGGYMVDCPHRERLGYGDGQVSVESCVMNLWMPNFYNKWLQDWADTQGPTGEIPFSTPYHPPASGDTFGREGPPGWGGALPSIAWRVYLYYGDRRVLKKMYDPMNRFMERMESHTTNDLLFTFGDKWQSLGDWVPPGRGMDTENWPSKRANALFNNCYRIYLWELMEKTARVLNRDDDAKRCLTKIEKIRPLIHNEFYDREKGVYVIDEQAYQVMPLMAGIVPDKLRPAIMKKLEDGILINRKGHLDTGMLGTYFLIQYLSKIGRDNLLFTIANQRTYPGWGYMLEKGATTMWEQWNGYWSRIHSCFTSPAGWFHNGLAGIRPDWTEPGFKKIIIKPALVGDLTWVRAHHDSPYGRIVSNWKREKDKFVMQVIIPTNTTAKLYLPAAKQDAATESGTALKDVKGILKTSTEPGHIVLELASGSYQFESKLL